MFRRFCQVVMAATLLTGVLLVGQVPAGAQPSPDGNGAVPAGQLAVADGTATPNTYPVSCGSRTDWLRVWTVYHGELCYATSGYVSYYNYSGHSATTNGICAGNNNVKVHMREPDGRDLYVTFGHNVCDDWLHHEGHPVEVYTIWLT
jgi:hypothetical protein